MLELNYTTQGRRPSAKSIVRAWAKAGKPTEFTVDYGKTFAHFELYLGRWVADGNGCVGVKRDEVERALNEDERGGV